MSGLILPARFRKQPQYAAKLDTGHPLMLGMTPMMVVNGQALVEVGANKPLIISGTTTDITIDAKAFGRSIDNAFGGAAVGVADGILNTNACVDFWYGQWLDNGANSQYLYGDYNANGIALAALRTADSNHCIFYDGTAFNDSGLTLTNGGFYLFVVAREVNGGVHKIYLNGSLIITGANAGATGGKLCFGALGQGFTGVGLSSAARTLLFGRLYGRGWSAAEVAQFSSNPWQIFKYPRRNWADAATGSTGISGDSSQTLDAVTTAAAAALQLKAASTITLADVTTAGATNLAIAAAGSKPLDDVTSSAAGALRNTGASTATLADVTSSTTGAVQIKASVSITLADVTASADSDLVITAGSSGQLDNVTLIATGVGTAVNTGASAVTLADVTGAGTATLRLQAASNVTLADVSTAGATTLYIVAASSKTLDAVTSSATGALRNTGAASITLANVTLSAAGAAEVPRTLLGPRPGGPRSTGNTRSIAGSASRPSATTRTRSTNR